MELLATDVPNFNSMAFNLMEGKDLDKYDHATLQRNRLVKTSETLSLACKNLMGLAKGANPRSDFTKVCRAVATRVTQFLMLHTIHQLPKPKEIEEFRRRREKSMRRNQAGASQVSGNNLNNNGVGGYRGEQSRGARGFDGGPRYREDLDSRPGAGTGNSRQAQALSAPDAGSRTPEIIRKSKFDAEGPSEEELREEAKRSLRQYIKKAQKAGRLDEVHALQAQLALMDEHI
eukprot:m.210234 g.210234  ORF g.210234 m.210234 type:complete len:232 (-) comp15822_c0_seq5:55-750(-)